MNFHTYLVENYLKESEQVEAYLKEALEQGDLKLLQAVVSDLIEADYTSFKLTKDQTSNELEAQNWLNITVIQLPQQALEVKVNIHAKS